MPQTILLAVEFKVEHKPGTPEQLHHIAKKDLTAKGVTYKDNVIVI
jgi:hypothetical protein